jgi:hypothetical protein
LHKHRGVSHLSRYYKYFSFIGLILALVLILSSCDSPGITNTVTVTQTSTQTTPTTSVTGVFNQPPVFVPIGDKIVPQGEVLQIILSATDPDNDNLTFAAFNLPAGATFDSSTQVFSWLPLSRGIYFNISFSVDDGKNTKLQTIQITVMSNIPSLLTPPSNGILPLAVYYYGIHPSAVDSRILGVKPQYIIINSANGVWGQISGRDILKDLTSFKAAGIKVIGYITSGYEGRGSAGNLDPKWYTLEMNQNLIKNMALIDRVDGIFIDECSPFPSQLGQVYLKTLTTLAHSYGLITWGNVGLAQFDSWFFTQGGFDLMQSDENWQGQNLSPVQNDWGYRISVTGSNPSYTAEDASRLTLDAWKKGLAFCYVNDSGYDSIAPWFEEYAKLLQK